MRRVAEKRQPLQNSPSIGLDQDGPLDHEMDIMDDILPGGSDAPEPEYLFEPVPDDVEMAEENGQAGDRPGGVQDRRARVEDVDDEESNEPNRWIKDYPGPAGATSGQSQSYFEKVRDEQKTRGEDPWAPFEDKDEWELAQWLIQNVGQNATDKFLKLPIVSRYPLEAEPSVKRSAQTRNRTKPSFKNKRAFYKRIDTLPRGPGWACEPFEITGDEIDEKGQLRKETLHLWKRDPVECIRELIGNPAFRDQMRYVPEKVYEDSEGKNRVFDEAWTGDWWWNLQVS